VKSYLKYRLKYFLYLTALKKYNTHYFYFYTVQELRYKSRIVNYLHPFLLF